MGMIDSGKHVVSDGRCSISTGWVGGGIIKIFGRPRGISPVIIMEMLAGKWVHSWFAMYDRWRNALGVAYSMKFGSMIIILEMRENE